MSSPQLTTEALSSPAHRHRQKPRSRPWLLTPDRWPDLGLRGSERDRAGAASAGAIEPFTHLSVQLTPPRRGDLWRLVDAQILDAHVTLRGSLDALACASAASELMSALAVEGATPRGRTGHYEVLLAYLRALAHRPMVANDLYRFLLLALETSGVRPRLATCARCGRGESTPSEHFRSRRGRAAVRELPTARVRGSASRVAAAPRAALVRGRRDRVPERRPSAAVGLHPASPGEADQESQPVARAGAVGGRSDRER